jgi:hypothetical protein
MERRAANAQTTKPAREEMAKGDDFETFIGQWAKEHIKPIDSHVDPDDLLYAATLRSDHLTLLAAQNGFYQPLRKKAMPYGGVVQYIVSLFDAKRVTQ